MSALRHSVVGSLSDKVCLAVTVGSKYQDSAAELLGKSVSQIAERVHVNARNLRCEYLNTVNLDNIVHNIAYGILCRLCLQRLDLSLQSLVVGLKMSYLFRKSRRLCLSCRSSLKKLLFDVAVILYDICSGNGLNTAYAGCYGRFRNDLEIADQTCVGNMGTTAEFLREITHRNNSYLGSVLLAEQSHRSGLLCLFDAHYIGLYSQVFFYLVVDDLLNPGQFLRGHGLAV